MNSSTAINIIPFKKSTEFFQQTLNSSICFKGIGVHSQKLVTMIIHPSVGDQGYVFIRNDLTENNIIHATYDAVQQTMMSTTLTNEHGVSISTVEHILAALYGCGITQAIIEVDGPEIPIMDGSSVEFVTVIEQAGIKALSQLEKKIKVLKPVHVCEGTSSIHLTPSKVFSLDVYFDFSGRVEPERASFTYNSHSFIKDFASARTFGFYEDAKKLWDKGLAKGSSFENTLVLDTNGKPLNESGSRFKDEMVRHKVLDTLGDLALAGGLIEGALHGVNTSHRLNNLLLRKLFSDSSQYTICH